jgi:hypothetical protein
MTLRANFLACLAAAAAVLDTLGASADDAIKFRDRAVSAYFDEASWDDCHVRSSVRICLRQTSEPGAREALLFMDLGAPADTVLALLTDTDRYCGWFDNCLDVESHDRRDDGGLVFSARVSSPFPYRDRVVTSQTHVALGSDDTIYVIGQTPRPLPETRLTGFRMPPSDGVWRIAPRAEGGSELAFYTIVNPGGGVPIAVTGPVLRGTTYQTFLNIRALLEADGE